MMQVMLLDVLKLQITVGVLWCCIKLKDFLGHARPDWTVKIEADGVFTWGK
jgi:hypothetical protein